MNELIKVTQNENGDLLVSARELHKGLDINSKYTDWISRMIDYGFEENVDYIVVNEPTQKKEGSRMVTRDLDNHVLKLDMAKEVAMIQRNDKGKQVRKYFINIEREYKNISTKDKYISEIEVAKAELSLVEATAKLLNLNDNSKLQLASNVYENHSIPQNLLPQYTQSKGILLSLTELLKRNNIKISSQKVNKLLLEKKIIKECTRLSTKDKNKVKKYKNLIDTRWGENQVNRNNSKETQPMYYDDKFEELMKLLGLL